MFCSSGSWQGNRSEGSASSLCIKASRTQEAGVRKAADNTGFASFASLPSVCQVGLEELRKIKLFP